jgi:nucleoside-diphosphate-sugar epimerase
VREQCFLLTGGTGALGSVLARQLLNRGFSLVCLARANCSQDAQERIRNVVGDNPQLTVLDGDICQPQCGLNAQAIARLRGNLAGLVHCAASINFSDEKSALAVNVGGLSNVLRLVESLGIPELHHVSTSYVAGTARCFTEGDCYVGQNWRNPYERSKFYGEQLIAGWKTLHPSCRVTIYRPSILAGHENGATTAFDGFYRYFQPLYNVAKSLREHLACGRLAPGVEILADGRIHLPLVLCASPTARINLIHVDWAAEMIASLIVAKPGPRNYHVTHPDPPLVRDALEWGLSQLGVEGAHVVDCEQARERCLRSQSGIVAKIQRRVDAVQKYFRPYMLTHPEFSSDATRVAMGGAYRAPSDINESALRRALGYAIDTQWGSVSSAAAH